MAKVRATAATIALVAAACGLSCSEESAIISGINGRSVVTFPASWEGLWEMETVMLSCDGDTLDTGVTSLTICEGDTLTLDAGLGFEVDCRGTIDHDSFSLKCDDVIDEDGCSTEVRTTWNARRSGDIIEGEIKMFANRIGAGCDFNGEFCFRFEQYATRIASSVCP